MRNQLYRTAARDVQRVRGRGFCRGLSRRDERARPEERDGINALLGTRSHCLHLTPLASIPHHADRPSDEHCGGLDLQRRGLACATYRVVDLVYFGQESEYLVRRNLNSKLSHCSLYHSAVLGLPRIHS